MTLGSPLKRKNHVILLEIFCRKLTIDESGKSEYNNRVKNSKGAVDV